MNSEQLKELRANNQFLSEPQAVIASEAGKYATRRIVFDFSHWQSKADGSTSVDWDALAKWPQVAGAYVKLGEVGNSGSSFEQITDNWMDSAFDSSIDGLYRNKLWIGAYIYLNCGWPLDRGWTQGGFDACHERGNKSEDEHANDLLRDPNIYLTVRKLKPGAGRVFDAAKLKSSACRDLPYDKLVVDVEDVYLNDGRLIGGGWMARTYSGYLKGMRWLMDHGYLKSREIWTYSSMWVVDSYGGPALATALESQPSICAGYYWNGTIKPTTVPELVSKYLATIPNNWTPRLFGIPKMFQVADSFTLEEVKGRTGQPSAVDVNVLNMTDTEFDADNPEWVARRGAVTPQPAPKKTYAKVLVDRLRMREGAGTGAEIAGFMAKDAEVEILEERQADGLRWGRFEGWMAIDGQFCRVRKE